jgi:hypothetical protein
LRILRKNRKLAGQFPYFFETGHRPGFVLARVWGFGENGFSMGALSGMMRAWFWQRECNPLDNKDFYILCG